MRLIFFLIKEKLSNEYGFLIRNHFICAVYKESLLALILVQICWSDTDSKRWVWSDARRRSDDDRLYTGSVNNDRKYTGHIGATAKPLFQPASNFGNEFQ